MIINLSSKENRYNLAGLQSIDKVLFNKRITHDAGWSSLVARRAHNPKVGGSNPTPATIEKPVLIGGFSVYKRDTSILVYEMSLAHTYVFSSGRIAVSYNIP